MLFAFLLSLPEPHESASGQTEAFESVWQWKEVGTGLWSGKTVLFCFVFLIKGGLQSNWAGFLHRGPSLWHRWHRVRTHAQNDDYVVKSWVQCGNLAAVAVSVVVTDRGVGMETEVEFVCVVLTSMGNNSFKCLTLVNVSPCQEIEGALWAHVDSALCESPQERFQVKSPPSTYLTKIKSLYQDQGGVSRRVSLNKHHLSSVCLQKWCPCSHVLCSFSWRNGSKMPPRSLKTWRYLFGPITLGECDGRGLPFLLTI